jgi:hypothetical protein
MTWNSSASCSPMQHVCPTVGCVCIAAGNPYQLSHAQSCMGALLHLQNMGHSALVRNKEGLQDGLAYRFVVLNFPFAATTLGELPPCTCSGYQHPLFKPGRITIFCHACLPASCICVCTRVFSMWFLFAKPCKASPEEVWACMLSSVVSANTCSCCHLCLLCCLHELCQTSGPPPSCLPCHSSLMSWSAGARPHWQQQQQRQHPTGPD